MTLTHWFVLVHFPIYNSIHLVYYNDAVIMMDYVTKCYHDNTSHMLYT